jgi:hypothetical protein
MGMDQLNPHSACFLPGSSDGGFASGEGPLCCGYKDRGAYSDHAPVSSKYGRLASPPPAVGPLMSSEGARRVRGPGLPVIRLAFGSPLHEAQGSSSAFGLRASAASSSGDVANSNVASSNVVSSQPLKEEESSRSRTGGYCGFAGQTARNPRFTNESDLFPLKSSADNGASRRSTKEKESPWTSGRSTPDSAGSAGSAGVCTMYFTSIKVLAVVSPEGGPYADDVPEPGRLLTLFGPDQHETDGIARLLPPFKAGFSYETMPYIVVHVLSSKRVFSVQWGRTFDCSKGSKGPRSASCPVVWPQSPRLKKRAELNSPADRGLSVGQGPRGGPLRTKVASFVFGEDQTRLPRK